MSKTDVKRGHGIAIRREHFFCIREVFGVRGGVTSSASQDQRKNLES